MKDQAFVDSLGTLALPASGSVYTRARPVRGRVSVVAAWTGSPVGAFRLQASFDGGLSWYDAPGYASQFTSGGNLQPAGGASAAVWTFLDVPGGLWRIAYAATSGTGSAVLSYALSDAGSPVDSPTALVAFQTAVPFRGKQTMVQSAVTGPIAFTVAAKSSVIGSETYVRLVANGVDTPTFTGLTESGGSMGYDNRAGVVNMVHFWFDGTDYLYAILQVVNPVPFVLSTVRLTGGTMSESGNASLWNYTSAGASYRDNPDRSLAALANGYFGFTLGTYSGHTAFCGWSLTASSHAGWADVAYGLYGDSSTGFYGPANGGSLPGANGNASVSRAVGDLVRSRRSGSSIFAEVSKDSGSTWTLIHTYTGASTAKLYPYIGSTSAVIATGTFSGGLT